MGYSLNKMPYEFELLHEEIKNEYFELLPKINCDEIIKKEDGRKRSSKKRRSSK